MPATVAILRGPLRFIHKPPAKAAAPTMKMASSKIYVTCNTDQP
jgi:hypothetical protein